MARKLIKRNTSSQSVEHAPRWGLLSLVVCLHVLLWSTLYVAASTTYLIATRVITISILPPAVVLLVACAVTLAYLASHNVAALYHRRPFGDSSKACKAARSIAKGTLRVALTLWMGGCGTNIFFTAARQPFCLVSGDSSGAAGINVGPACFLQRAGVAASLLALLSTVTLFILMIRVREPYRCHLLGISNDTLLLPMILPDKMNGNPMFSEMSFKCRSSTSLSDATLIASHESEKEDYGMYPTRSEKAYGLGISTPKRATASFLAARPSLSSIKEHTSNGPVPPPSSPLPPLPAYFPGREYRASQIQRAAGHPRSLRASRKPRIASLPTAPYRPGLLAPDLQVFQRSTESLSSVYSRSVSGEDAPLLKPPGLLAASSRSSSSSSTTTLRRSPLQSMHCASQPYLPDQEPRSSSESFDIDDVATLQARLPSVKSVSTFGDVAFWAPPMRDDGSRVAQRSWASYESLLGSCVVPPLAMRKFSAGISRPGTERCR